jgi:hypothetical protein
VVVVEQPPKGGGDVMIRRDCSHTCIHLALLCICDACALYATDQSAVMAWRQYLFMVIIASYLYDTHSVDTQLVLYTSCYTLCMRLAARDDITLCHDRSRVV